jgi:hypothetical protein
MARGTHISDFGRVSAAEKPDTFAPDRNCHEPGCITVLSIYNRGPFCFLHAQKRSAAVVDEDVRRSRLSTALSAIA